MRKYKRHWFFKDRFSYFDLIPIFIIATFTNFVLDHLYWS